jgi:hypothetical protein
MSVQLSEAEIERHLSGANPENVWWLGPYLRGETDLDGTPLPATEEHLS